MTSSKNISFTPLILAGGLGTRLQSVIPGLPKALAIVKGRPFLSYLLDQLINVGAREVVLCVGYLGELIIEEFGNTYKDLNIQYSHESTPLGTGGAIRYAFNLICSDSILVMNGDSYCDIDLNSYVNWHFENRYNVSLILTNVEKSDRYGGVKIDKDGYVLSFKEKEINDKSGWVNGGVYMLRKSALSSIPIGIKLSLERDFLPKLIDEGLYGFCFHGKFIDIGIPESYLLAEKFFSGNSV